MVYSLSLAFEVLAPVASHATAYRCAVISSICASFDCIRTVLGDFANKLAVIY